MPFISNGTTILDNGAFSVGLGSKILLSTATASSSASLSFNSTYINSDYLIYKFEFINLNASTADPTFLFNMSIDNGSNYNVTKTSTAFRAIHNEAGTVTQLIYRTNDDLAQSTAYQVISASFGSASKDSLSGSMYLFNPSSSVFAKHFISDVHITSSDLYSQRYFIAGYGNITTAVDAIDFKAGLGNINAGQIKLYGIKGS